MSIIRCSAATVLLSVPALAQTNGTYLLTSSNTVSLATPTTTIEIWATWEDPAIQYYFGSGDYDLTAGEGLFSNPINVLNGPLSSTGVIAGNVISGARNGQIRLPPFIPLPPAMLDNPMLLATYEWTTTEFSPRSVDLHTGGTTMFIVGDVNTRAGVELYPHEFSPGSGVINVVPAPVAWVVLALPLLAAERRRRS